MPKTLLLFTLIFCTHLVAQTLTFNNEPVDAIEISAHLSARQANGKTSGKQDFYSILFNQQTKLYQLSVYKKTKYTLTFQPPSRVEKIKIVSKAKILNRDLLSDLLQSFEAGTIAPNSENYGIPKNQFDALTSTKSILKIIKTKKLKQHLSPIKLNKAEIAQIATTAQNRDTFDLYLSTRFANPTFTKPVGTDNSFEVTIKTSVGAYQFEASVVNPYKQPWIVLKSNNQASMTILNFNIHRALAAILPESFLLRGSLLPEALIEDYVSWCMKRRGFIWEC
jgi:hypothetical protein